MERLSGLYGRVSGVAAEPQMELARYLDHFRRLDFGSVYPLLLALYEDYSEGQFALADFVEFFVWSFYIALQDQTCNGNALGLALGIARGRRQEPQVADRCGVRRRLGAVHFVC